MRIPAHSPWLPGYINVEQTVVILTVAGLFLDRPGIGEWKELVANLQFTKPLYIISTSSQKLCMITLSNALYFFYVFITFIE